MEYVKITNENVGSLVVDGAILAHCKEKLPENILDAITEDKTVDIVDRIDNKVSMILPDGLDSPQYGIDYFADGHWWLKDYSKEKHPVMKTSKYVTLTSSIIFILLGMYMLVYNTNFSGFDGPGRFGGPTRKGTISGPFVLLFGLAFLWMYIMIARDEHRKDA